MKAISIQRLLEAGVHFGHRKDCWNPKMRPYIFGERNGVYVIDLVQTSSALDRACEFVRKAAADRKNIVFVGTKKLAADIIEEEAKRCGAHYVNRRWLGGMLTNFDTMRLRINRLKELEEMRDTGDFYRRPKKELAVLNREMFKLEKSLGGLKNLHGRPEVLYIVDQGRETIAVKEAKIVGAAVIGVIDTNCDPDGIDYVIPGNDDSIRSIKLITRTIADAVLGYGPDAFGSGSDDDGPDLHPSGVPRRHFPTSGHTEIALTLPDWEEDENSMSVFRKP